MCMASWSHPCVPFVQAAEPKETQEDAADSGAHTKRSGGVSGADKGRWQKAEDVDQGSAPPRRDKREGRRPPAPAPDDMNPYADPDKALKSWEARCGGGNRRSFLWRAVPTDTHTHTRSPMPPLGSSVLERGYAWKLSIVCGGGGMGCCEGHPDADA